MSFLARPFLIGLLVLGTGFTALAQKPLPKVLSIVVEPTTLTFYDGRDTRSVLVTGQTANGYSLDLSPVAKFQVQGNSIVKVDEEGKITPLKAGKTLVTVTAGGKTTTLSVNVKSAVQPPMSFVREVMPVMSKVGCNAGTCHGSAKGKNGFKLSLRGYDPAFDYHALVDDVLGRRCNRVDPAQSLMLLKSTAKISHKGGAVLFPGTANYAVLEGWIREGVKDDSATAAKITRLEVLPKTPNLTLPGMTQKTLVIAHYTDGTTRDVSRLAVSTSSMPEVATTSPLGTLTAVRRGEAALLVRYEGNYASTALTVIGDRTGYQWTQLPLFNYVDKHVDTKLQKIKTIPSPLCDDSTFLRRVSIDLVGLPPTPEVVRAFVADKSPVQIKRAKLVDNLLASAEYNERWTNKWSDLLSANSKFLGERGVRKFRNWIQTSIASNKPYNQFVRELVLASGDSYENAPANFYRVNNDTSKATENVTQLFLGIRFSCNKCHDHPFERWTQNQYYQFGAFFARVAHKSSQMAGSEVVFAADSGEVTHPKTNAVVPPKVPIGRSPKLASFGDRRTGFAEWLTATENPYFSRAIVNRLWSYFFGKGIIDPVDDIRGGNPPSNPELLEALNADFVKSGYDMRHIMRVMALSRTYQSSLGTNKWNVDDIINFSHAMPRRLEAEQLLDAIHEATATVPKFEGLPIGTKAKQLPDAAIAGGDLFLSLFGRPARESPCECERVSNVSLGQALNLINGPTISDAIANPAGRLARFMQINPSDEQVIEEIFLSTLCRYPTAKERKDTLNYIKQSPSRMEGAQDLSWALINSPAFLFNR
ncbi:MAG: DUF1549 and DUF1553 domain-containing protein [Armatimonadetes bacterium]|nr:DUF1549 and DUF1553 domain-containing protein [Armatimonadota bacterium]